MSISIQEQNDNLLYYNLLAGTIMYTTVTCSIIVSAVLGVIFRTCIYMRPPPIEKSRDADYEYSSLHSTAEAAKRAWQNKSGGGRGKGVV